MALGLPDTVRGAWTVGLGLVPLHTQLLLLLPPGRCQGPGDAIGSPCTLRTRVGLDSQWLRRVAGQNWDTNYLLYAPEPM